MERLTTHKATLRPGQEDVTGGDLARLAQAAHGGGVTQDVTFVAFLASAAGGDEWGPRRAGGDGVDADAAPHQLIRQGAREGHNGALAGRVVQPARNADVGVDRRAVNDGAAFRQVRQRILGDVEVRVDIGAERVAPLLPIG